jgi:hypothetical protein
MSILVVCTGCKKSFQVADKFAGKSGPCPKCKAIIKVPAKGQEVQIHGGEEFGRGGRDAAGQLVLKPIARRQIKFNPTIAAAIGGAALAVLVVAWIGGSAGAFTNVVGAGLGLLVISPVLVLAAYTFLYDDELEPYRGKELYLRAAACSAAYIVLWGIFAYVKDAVTPNEPQTMTTATTTDNTTTFSMTTEEKTTTTLPPWSLFLAAPFLVVGGIAAWASLDLEPTNGFFHYTFYLLVTIILRWAAGLGWVWQVVPPSSGA